jgi:hypothetical protein
MVGKGGKDGISLYLLTHGGILKRFDFSVAAPVLVDAKRTDLPPEGSVADISLDSHNLYATLQSGERILLSTSNLEAGAMVKQQSKAADVFVMLRKFDDTQLGPVTSDYVLWIE